MSSPTSRSRDTASLRAAGSRDAHRWTVADAAIILACLALGAAFMVPVEPQVEPLPHFTAMDTQERKEEFFAYLRPLVEELNLEIAEEGEFIESVQAKAETGRRLTLHERSRVESLASHYEIESGTAGLDDVIDELAHRIGRVPESLVLVQAAKESGWGTSRFAVEGNNLFGQRCYETGCGIRPRGRPEGTRFGVAKYGSARESLKSYIRNLNTHPEYEAFRRHRAELRSEGRPLLGSVLAATLDGYSERGQAYVDEIRAMIRQNGLE